MVMKDFAPYFDFETKVKITTADAQSFIGVITGFEDELDTESKKDELELDVGRAYALPSIFRRRPLCYDRNAGHRVCRKGMSK